MSPGEIDKIDFIETDITDPDAVMRAGSSDGGVKRIIHTAALQVPFVRKDPRLGAMVNVVGTVNIFSLAKELGIPRVVYASSVAVYGPPELYADAILPSDAILAPAEHYGVHKQCNEAAAKVYWAHDHISSIGLRPHTVYGPGRDRGLTSEPTLAMEAAARGESFTINYGGRSGFMFVEDVARTFIRAATVPFEGAAVFGMKGHVVEMSEIADTITRIAGLEPGQISFAPTELPFPAGMDDTELRQLLGDLPEHTLDEGISRTIDHFARSAVAGDGEKASS
jgi:nucleoside-diphosphate-sugar epimerase